MCLCTLLGLWYSGRIELTRECGCRVSVSIGWPMAVCSPAESRDYYPPRMFYFSYSGLCWWSLANINKKPLHLSVISFSTVGSVCCSYAGHHTNCREFCQAIFRTDSSPGPSQIKAVENYCASISPQLIHCVNNYTQSYPMRNPTDSKWRGCVLLRLRWIIHLQTHVFM